MYPHFRACVKLKPVCLLLCLCHAGSTAAFGLGEISVRSFLGQPLDATVTLLDTTPAVTADCFSLGASTGSIAPPPRAQLSIELAGEQRLLHIRTTQPIHDPVAQFALVSDCEARLQRDYVVLLDPPAQVEAVSVREGPAAQQTAAASIATPASTAPHRPHHVKRAPAVTAPARPSATAPHQPAIPPQAAAGVPRLVLSGKHRVSPAADTPIAPRLDNQLPDPAQPRPEQLTATELSDENTALNRKLAHLEAQMAALQQRYAALEARRTASSATVMPPPPKQPARWPLYLLAIGLLTGAGVLTAWRRQRGRNPHPLEMVDTLPALAEMTHTPELTPERMPEVDPPPSEEGTEVKEDILDQAEVFLAHGHSELAAHLLQEHLREAPTESPVPWLLLLDLLHRAGDTAGYATASAECRRYFNVNLSGHPIVHDSETTHGLEAYPHLLEQLVHVWNSPDIGAFFNDLIYDHRGGTRLGFEPGAYRDILLLRAIAQQALPLAA